MSVRNVIEKAESMIGKVSPRYDMSFRNTQDLYKNYGNRPLELMYYSFNFGYLQGMKAAKAEMEKGGAVNA